MINYEYPERELEFYDVIVDRGRSYHFIYGDKTEHIRRDGLVGLEIEMAYNANMVYQRQMARSLEKFKKMTPKTITYGAMKRIHAELLGSRKIVRGTPHSDGGGLESVCHPATLSAHKKMKEEYRILLELYSKLGYDAGVWSAGIHSNIDYSLFGATDRDSIAESVELFFWFLFKNSDFMTMLSKRPGHGTINSDMYTLLNNKMGNMSEEDLLATFKRRKREASAYLRDASESSINFGYQRYFNISLGRDGRPGLEWRWFGSTEDVDTLMMMIECSFALPEFIRTHRNEEEMDLPVFANFVRENIQLYPNLLEELYNNEFSTSMMRKQLAPEQTVPRRRLVVY